MMLALLVASLVTEAPALARQGGVFYVDGSRPVNGAGTEFSPFNSLNRVPAVENAQVYVGGILRETAEWSGLRRGTVVQQWPGKLRAELRGDVVVPPGEWARRGNGLFSTTIPSSPSSVVWNWDTNVDSSGRHFGHLRGAASLQECQHAVSTWFYDQSSMTLYVHQPPGAQPPDQGDAYAWVRTGSGFTINNGDGVTIDGLRLCLWSDSSPGGGYGIRLNNGIGATISNCLFEDCGYHSAGFVGNVCRDNRLINCIGRGLHGRSNHFVFYSLTEDIVGCRAEKCEAHLYGVLDWQGRRLDPNDYCGGYYSHTGLSAARVRDLEYNRCRAIGYDDSSGNAFGAGSYTGSALDGRNAYSYPIRFVECAAENCDFVNVEGHVAFIRCRLDFRKAAISGGNSSSCFVFNRAGTQVAIESSEFITRLDGTSVSRVIWPKNPGDTLYLMGVTFFDEFPGSASRSFVRTGDTSHVVAEQCVFTSSADMYLTNGSSANTAENFDFVNCWYHHIGPSHYSVCPDLNERSEWTSLVDPNGWYDINPNLANPPADLAPEPDGALWRVRVPLDGVSRLGITGAAYDGRLGAHQFGWPTAHLNICPCPSTGALQMEWWQATPGGTVAILYSDRLGTVHVPPSRPCPGLTLDLSAPALVIVGTQRSDSFGSGKLNATVMNPQVCGGYAQMVDLGSCTTTNVLHID